MSISCSSTETDAEPQIPLIPHSTPTPWTRDYLKTATAVAGEKAITRYVESTERTDLEVMETAIAELPTRFPIDPDTYIYNRATISARVARTAEAGSIYTTATAAAPTAVPAPRIPTRTPPKEIISDVHKWNSGEAIAVFQTWASDRPSPRNGFDSCWAWATINRGTGARADVYAMPGDEFRHASWAIYRLGASTTDTEFESGAWFIFTSSDGLEPDSEALRSWVVYEDSGTVRGTC